jgi:hypothetical protein
LSSQGTGVTGSSGGVERCGITFLLSATLKPLEIIHLSSIGYLKSMEITVSSVGQLRPTEVVVLSSVLREVDGNYFGR